MNIRPLISIFTLTVAAGAVYLGATGAFFSDIYASQDHVFTAGTVDIEMSNIEHTYQGEEAPNDPTGFVYDNGIFSFGDLKPLDTGLLEFTVGNGDNEAYVCAYVTGDVPVDAAGFALYDNIQFYNTNGGDQIVFNQWFDLGVIAEDGSTQYAIDYCFGNPTTNAGGIVSCGIDPLVDYNAAQGGEFMADIYLFAIQTRSNSGFTCDAIESFEPGTGEVVIDYDYLPEAPVTLVGAEVVAYTPPADPVASCDLTVDASAASPVAPLYNTLTAAEADAVDGDTICVDTGSYTEDVTIDVPNLTILGLNDPKLGDKATIDGRMDIDSDGVTVSGLEFTNPDAGYGIVIDGGNDTEIAFNSFVDIGTAYTGRSAQAIYYDGNPGAASNLNIHDNMIDGVGSVALDPTGPGSGSSAKGIFIGDSTSPNALTGVVIEDNEISNIVASSDPFASGGRGAYAILINYGVGSTGSVVGPIIRNNTIDTLSGWWVHAVGLETDTPGASVTLNRFANLVGGSIDASAVFYEGNPNSNTAVNFNNFDPAVPFGVALHPTNQPAISVDAENNWWGDTDPSDNVGPSAGTIDYVPFEAAAFGIN